MTLIKVELTEQEYRFLTQYREDEKNKTEFQQYVDLLKMCYEAAHMTSSDHSNTNAALIVTAFGKLIPPVANKLPEKITWTEERTKVRPTKYDFIEHAERGVIYSAARKGISTEGATMVCPWVACADCSRAIVNAGIVKVVTHRQRNDLTSLGRENVIDTTSDRWVNPISNGAIILQEGGVEVVQLDFVAGLKTLINEKVIEI